MAKRVELPADLDQFPDLSAAAAVLDRFLDLARGEIWKAVIDPRAVRLPEGHRDQIATEMIDELERNAVPVTRFFASIEHQFDINSETSRRIFARLAYCSTLASVWGHESSRELFEADDYGEAWYVLPPDMASMFVERLAQDGMYYPPTWNSSPR